MFKDSKEIWEFIIDVCVLYLLCKIFGFVFGILIALVIIPILMFTWRCLCWLVVAIFSIGVSNTDDDIDDELDDTGEEEPQDTVEVKASTDSNYGCLMGLLFTVCVVGTGLCSMYVWEWSYLIGMPVLIVLLIISMIKYRKAKKNELDK